MKTITQHEFRDSAAAVIDAVEAGETFHITRDGVKVAELRPMARRRRRTAYEFVTRHRGLSRLDHARMRAEADNYFFGGL